MVSDPDSRKLLYKIAKAYYDDGLTQQQIGARLGLSRIKVSRLLRAARAERVVQISIAPPQESNAGATTQEEAMNPQRPIVSEPDQRYWRARANRKVRKARYTRIVLRWSLILLINGAFLGALVFIGLRGAQRLASSEEFALRKIELVGLERASDESIRSRIPATVSSS